MAKQKRRVFVSTCPTNPQLLFVSADAVAATELNKIEGLVILWTPRGHDLRYWCEVSELYDVSDVIREIESLNKDEQIPDAFKDATEP